jgi:NADH:ubiquinone oxidoreductase subunit K
MSNNEVQAIIVLILTAATAAGFYFRRPIITMLASLLNLLFVCFLLFIYVGAKANPEPGEFSQIMLMSFSWGWLVILGASLVMAVASFKTRSERKVEASNVST